MVDVAAIVLAAGRATRFIAHEDGSRHGNKVYAALEGRALVTHVAAAAAASRATPTIVVTGHGAERAPAALQGFAVVLVHNPHFVEGMAGSLAAGIAAVPATADAALILLADMPRVRPATLDAIIAAYEREPHDAIVPLHRGQRGNPVLISRALFPAVTRLTGDQGARRILADGSHRVLCLPVGDPGVLLDVDTKEALDTLAPG